MLAEGFTPLVSESCFRAYSQIVPSDHRGTVPADLRHAYLINIALNDGDEIRSGM